MTMTTHGSADRASLVAWLTELLGLVRHIEQRYEDKARIESQFPPPKQALKPWGWKGFALSIVVSLLVLSGLLSNLGILSYLIYPLWPAVGIGFPIVWNKVLVPRGNAQRQQSNRELAARMREATSGVDAELEKAGRIYATRFEAGFPEAYVYSDAVAYCLGAVQQHRADTVGQAITLYETERHRQRLEETQERMLEEQQLARRQQAGQAVIGAALQGATLGAILHGNKRR